MRYHRSTGTGPHSPYSTAPLPNDVSVCPVPRGHFGKLRKDLIEVVLVCDRYSAYKSLALECEELILAFCWAHVRRDFLKAARSWPELEGWMFTWVVDIRELSHLNATRLAQ